MKLSFVLTAGSLMLLVSGCSSHRAIPVYHAGDEKPPVFLTGAASMALTNLGGFDARILATIETTEEPHRHMSGDLLGREGRLIFQPALALKGKRARAE